ncbi:hypothetical protein ACLOJK_001304 [Asimina triloba]
MSASVGKRGYREEEGADLRRGPWTIEEDNLLIHSIACHGEGRWNLLAQSAGLKRTGKSCRLRWLNYLKPDVKRGNLSAEEQLLILELHAKWGNRWSKIARYLPGRTDNEIKNFWRTKVQKQARQLKVDANSTKFREAIRCFWMPRLLQKTESVSSMGIGSSSQLSNTVPDHQPSFLDNDHKKASDPIVLSNACKDLKSICDGYNGPSLSSDSMNICPPRQASGCPTSPKDFGNPHDYDDPSLKGYDHVVESTYGSLDCLNNPPSTHFDCQIYDCPILSDETTDWVGGMGDSLWSLDELWQLVEMTGTSNSMKPEGPEQLGAAAAAAAGPASVVAQAR